MAYEPHPIDTAHVHLPEDIVQLIERLAENAHDHWARRRMAEGWTYGPMRNDITKEHPCLVPYHALPESEKQYDWINATEMLKTIIALGYQLTKASLTSGSADGPLVISEEGNR